jgi:hypothetical protein
MERVLCQEVRKRRRPEFPAENCPDCGVRPGQYHEPRCDVERFPDCGKTPESCGKVQGNRVLSGPSMSCSDVVYLN